MCGVTFSKHIVSLIGDGRQQINVLKDGKIVGQLWTFKDTIAQKHPWHCKLSVGSGVHQKFWGDKATALAHAKLHVKFIVE